MPCKHKTTNNVRKGADAGVYAFTQNGAARSNPYGYRKHAPESRCSDAASMVATYLVHQHPVVHTRQVRTSSQLVAGIAACIVSYPQVQRQLLVLDRFHVEANSRHCLYWLADAELEHDSCGTRTRSGEAGTWRENRRRLRAPCERQQTTHNAASPPRESIPHTHRARTGFPSVVQSHQQEPPLVASEHAAHEPRNLRAHGSNAGVAGTLAQQAYRTSSRVGLYHAPRHTALLEAGCLSVVGVSHACLVASATSEVQPTK